MSSEELLRTSRRRPKMDDRGMMDVPFLVLVLLLVAIGLLMMFSASYVRANYETGNSLHYFIRQASFALFTFSFISRSRSASEREAAL